MSLPEFGDEASQCFDVFHGRRCFETAIQVDPHAAGVGKRLDPFGIVGANAPRKHEGFGTMVCIEKRPVEMPSTSSH